jgi:hypothetical protein
VPLVCLLSLTEFSAGRVYISDLQNCSLGFSNFIFDDERVTILRVFKIFIHPVFFLKIEMLKRNLTLK